MTDIPPPKKSHLLTTEAEDEDFILDRKSAFLSKTTFTTNAILISLFIIFFAGIIWAYFAKLDQQITGEGKVIPYSQVKIIQSLDGGIVLDIPVKEGDIVKKGQVILHLDQTRYKADYESSYTKFLALTAMVARLRAEAFNDEKINFPSALLKEEPELAAQETRLFETRKKALQQELNLMQKTLDFSNQEVAMYKPLVEKQYVSKIAYIRAQRDANELENKILEKKNQFHKSTLEEYNQKNAELSILQDQIKSLQDKMERTTLYSPVYGIIKKVNTVTIGGVITAGSDIMEIVPLSDHLLVQARIKPQDIGFIHIGQKATVRISAFDYTIYGNLEGKVEYISPDAIEESKSVADREVGGVYYLVNIRSDNNYVGSGNHKLTILPGMTGTVQIITGKERVLDILLKPLIKAKEEASREKI